MPRQVRSADLQVDHFLSGAWITFRAARPTSAADALAWAARVDIPHRQPVVVHMNGAREIVLPSDHASDGDTGAVFETRFVWVDGRWLPGEA